MFYWVESRGDRNRRSHSQPRLICTGENKPLVTGTDSQHLPYACVQFSDDTYLDLVGVHTLVWLESSWILLSSDHPRGKFLQLSKLSINSHLKVFGAFVVVYVRFSASTNRVQHSAFSVKPWTSGTPILAPYRVPWLWQNASECCVYCNPLPPSKCWTAFLRSGGAEFEGWVWEWSIKYRENIRFVVAHSCKESGICHGSFNSKSFSGDFFLGWDSHIHLYSILSGKVEWVMDVHGLATCLLQWWIQW